MKYVYMCYFKLTQRAFQRYLEDPTHVKEWVGKAREVCGRNGAKPLILGSPYGLEEQLVVGVETEADVEGFTRIKNELYRIDTGFIEYSKTSIIIQV